MLRAENFAMFDGIASVTALTGRAEFLDAHTVGVTTGVLTDSYPWGEVYLTNLLRPWAPHVWHPRRRDCGYQRWEGSQQGCAASWPMREAVRHDPMCSTVQHTAQVGRSLSSPPCRR